jgi:hypothetical protein
VCELVDLTKAFAVSVSVGPASGTLKGREPSEWRAREVADTVLIDKSTARITTGQRVALNDVQSSKAEERDGATYYVYEHLSEKAPTKVDSKESYRHALSVTAVRPGLNGLPYLYTMNVACPDALWEDVEAAAVAAISSFRLTEPAKGYVAPDKDPWMFF